MPVLSLKERIDMLEHDLRATPMRVGVYRDMPFGILRYDPPDEWKVRDEARRLATRLGDAGREVVFVSLAEVLWEALEECEGLDAIVRKERESGFLAAQAQITTYLSDDNWAPIEEVLGRKLKGLDPRRQIVFVTRAAAMAPAIYFLSTMLDKLKTDVTMVLFYPGAREGENQLRFMDMKGRDALSTYRATIYG